MVLVLVFALVLALIEEENIEFSFFFFVEEEEEIKGVELSVSIPRTIYTLTLCLFSIQGSELKDEPYHSDTDPEVSIVQQELFHIILRKRFVAHTAHVKRA